MKPTWRSLQKTGSTSGTGGTADSDEGVSVPLSESGRWYGSTATGYRGSFVPPVPPTLSEGLRVVQPMFTGFVPPVPRVPHKKQTVPLPAWVPPQLPHQDHEGWTEDFGRWALAHCLFRDRCWGGITALHAHLCTWCAERGEAGPWLATFEALLADEGFLLGGGLVAGLILREDWEDCFPTSRLCSRSLRRGP